METILYTKTNELTIRTCYIADEEKFAVIFEYPNGEMQEVDTFKSVLFMLEIHDFWCKFAGLTSTSLNPSQVKKHLTRISRTA